MSSLKQIEANRRNALKSTGPITSEGKARSCRNAIRHGLTAETVIGGLEDIEDYKAFEAAITADYDAETAVERELVLRLASVLWRLRRATGVETGLFESVTAEPGKGELRHSHLSLVGPTELPEQNHLFPGVTQQSNAAAEGAPNIDSKRGIVDGFFRLTALPTFPLDRLSRYEHLLWRQARQIVVTLKSPQYYRRPPRPSPRPFSSRRGYSDEFK